MRNATGKLISVLALLGALCSGGMQVLAQNRVTFGGEAVAWDFAYGLNAGAPALLVTAGSSNAGTYTITLAFGAPKTASGITFMPFSGAVGQPIPPIAIGVGTAYEVVTPTAVSCSTPNIQYTCQITAAFAYAHSNGDTVRSGSYGLQDAINYMTGKGGGIVLLESGFASAGGSNTTITSAVITSNTILQDNRGSGVVYWTPEPSASTVLAAPTTLTSTTAAPTSTPAGSYTTGTYHLCLDYVDAVGQEGPCSADFSEAGVASGSFTFSSPAASAGAVGYAPYISLVNGGYTLMYKVPLTSAICTLTTVETTTPACAVTNTAYNQVGSTAVVTALTVNTSPTAINSGVISTTAITHGNANGRTTYSYVPGAALGLQSIPDANFAFPTTAAAATTVPSVLGTINIPPGFMNILGRKLRLCGYATSSGASTATVLDFNLQWDSFGQNTAGLPVKVADAAVTPASAFAGSVVNGKFCFTLVSQVVGAGATAGTLAPIDGFAAWSNTATGISATGGPIVTTAGVGSLNLASEARLHIVYNHTTGTDGAGFILTGVTLEAQ